MQETQDPELAAGTVAMESAAPPLRAGQVVGLLGHDAVLFVLAQRAFAALRQLGRVIGLQEV